MLLNAATKDKNCSMSVEHTQYTLNNKPKIERENNWITATKNIKQVEIIFKK